jgi:hypothetical protein
VPTRGTRIADASVQTLEYPPTEWCKYVIVITKRWGCPSALLLYFFGELESVQTRVFSGDELWFALPVASLLFGCP